MLEYDELFNTRVCGSLVKLFNNCVWQYGKINF